MFHFAGEANDTVNRVGYYTMLVMVAKLGAEQGVKCCWLSEDVCVIIARVSNYRNIKTNFLSTFYLLLAASSKAWVCSHSSAGIAGSNRAGSMDICLF